MKNLVFLTMGYLSSGEFTIAVEFARGLDKKKYNIIFVTSEEGKNYIHQNGFEVFVVQRTAKINKYENREIINDFLNKFKPDLFLISDVYILDYSYSWSGINIEFLKKFNKKIVNFDEYEYRNSDYIVDYYGNLKSQFVKLQLECDYLLAHCPLNKVSPKDKDNVYHFSLFQEELALSNEIKNQVRKELDSQSKFKIIFLATSRWETLNVTNFKRLSPLLKWLPVIIMNYLNLLDTAVLLIHVGPQKWDDTGFSNIKYHHYSYLHPEKFDKYLLSSDLFITTNLVSVTLSKAIYGNVPSILINNDKIIDFIKLKDKLINMPEWYQQMANEVEIAYPYYVFPFGWYNFLKCVISDNKYFQTFAQAPLFQKTKCIETIQKYLFNESEIRKLLHQQNEFLDEVLKLSKPRDILSLWEKMN